MKRFICLLLSALSAASQRTTPPSGAVVVRGSGTQVGEFSTVQAAVNALPNDTSIQTIFIYPGVYPEQVSITRVSQTVILGYTNDPSSYEDNSVTITFNLSASQTGSNNDETATLRVHKDNFALYNVNLRNLFGKSSSGGQALALSAYGTNQSYYGVGFFGYQDTLLTMEGNQFYGSCYIEGAVDYIYGQHARTVIHNSTIASVAPGAITASGPCCPTDVSLWVINKCSIVTSLSATTDLTSEVFLGRPWTQYANAGWEQWSSATPNTDGVLFGEYNNTGPGSVGPRAPFVTILNSTSGFTFSDVLGDSWTTWVDQSYV